jgi:tetratricopeptide (TPR) repeat protein
LEALLLHSKGEYAKSIAVARKSLNVDPGDFIALLSITWSLQGLERHEEALIYADRLIETHNIFNKLLGLEEKARSLIALGKGSEALALVNEGLRILPRKREKTSLGLLKVDALLLTDRLDEAFECLDQLTFQSNEKIVAEEILFRKAIVAGMLHNTEIMKKVANEYFIIDPNSPESSMLRILLSEANNEFDEAERMASAELEKTTDRVHKEAFSFMLLGIYYSMSKRFLKEENTERVKALFVDAIHLKENMSFEHFRSWLFAYFDQMLPLGKFDLILEVNSIADQKLSEEDKQTIAPIVRAAEYVATRNVDILEKLQKETRQVVVSIIKKYSPRTSLPKQL